MKKYDIFIEKPIKNKKEDIFGIESYALSIKNAIKHDAKFIAIDGDFGSGKSSILNIVKEKYRIKTSLGKVKFVDINFLNINKTIKEPGENELNCYHRYFANQVVNDICKNPFTIEKLFYNSFISVATTKNDSPQIWKIIIDKLLLILLSFITLMITYSAFLKGINSLLFVNDLFIPLLPWAIYITFILLIIYGYGIFKPDHQNKSPMLEVDKTRNNLLKAVQNNLRSKSKLIFVIDDLDRLNSKIQKEIISLLYNEYYPLSGQIRKIDFCFIFMINNEEIISSDNEKSYDYKKIFDFILKVSSNQKFIIRDYVHNCFSNGTLKEIIDNCKYKNFLIGIIVNKYNSIRELKHIFNKIINKYIYLNEKKNFRINYDEMVLIEVLNDIYNTKDLDELISNSLKNKDNASSIIIQEALNNNILDVDYYLYLYNFAKSDSLLNNEEDKLYKILIKEDYEKQDVIDINKILNDNNDIRLPKIYDEIYPYLSKNSKLMLLTNKKFFEYSFVEIPKNHRISIEEFKNLYQNSNALPIYLNIKDTLKMQKENNIKEMLCEDIVTANLKYINNSSEENYKIIEKQLVLFVKNFRNMVMDFNDLNLFGNIEKMSDDLFSELFIKDINGWYLFYENIIKCESIIDKLTPEVLLNINLLKEKDIKESIKDRLLEEKMSYKQIHSIIFSEPVNIDIKKLYSKFLEENISVSFKDLTYLIDTYGYNAKCDNFIIKEIEKSPQKVKEFIDDRDLLISSNIIDAFSSIKNRYAWKDKYNDLFANNGAWNLYVYSKIIKNNAFNLPNKYLENEECIKEAVRIYCNVRVDDYEVDKKMTLIFLQDKYIGDIVLNFENNKIGQLSFFMTDKIIDKILNIVEENNLIDKYCTIITENNYLITKKFLSSFKDRFYNQLSSQLKRKITKKINLIA